MRRITFDVVDEERRMLRAGHTVVVQVAGVTLAVDALHTAAVTATVRWALEAHVDVVERPRRRHGVRRDEALVPAEPHRAETA